MMRHSADSVRFDHITPVFPVKDVQAAATYFCDKLGFTQQSQIIMGQTWLYVTRASSGVLLVPFDWWKGFSIRVDNVDEVQNELLNRNATFESGATNQQYGERDFLVQGPEGLCIRFWSPNDSPVPDCNSGPTSVPDADPF